MAALAAIFDLDDTLADASAVDDWTRVTSTVIANMPPFRNLTSLARRYVKNASVNVAIITGRSNELRPVTLQWCERYLDVSQAKNPVSWNFCGDDPDGWYLGKLKAARSWGRRISRPTKPSLIEVYDNDVKCLQAYQGLLADHCQQITLWQATTGSLSQFEW